MGKTAFAGRFFLLALALAFVFAVLAAGDLKALSEYAFLLQPPESSFAYYAVYPKSCSGFLNAGADAGGSLTQYARAGFAFEKAIAASNDLKKARTHAMLQPRFLNLVTLELYRFHSTTCFYYGIKALREASESTREGLKLLDEHSEKLAAMVGGDANEIGSNSGYSGLAGGVKSELTEAKAAIEKRDASGKGFGASFVKTALTLNSTMDSEGITRAVISLIGKTGLLEKEILLDDRISKAGLALEEEFRKLEEERDSTVLKVAFLKKEFEKEKLRNVGESAFSAVEGASELVGAAEVGSFERDYGDAVELEASSEELARQGKARWKAEEKGFASQAIGKMSEANAGLKKAESILSEAIAASEELEDKLTQKLNALKNEAERLAGRSANALAVAEARRALDDSLNAGFNARISTRGEKISSLLKNIARFEELNLELRKPSDAVALEERTSGKLEGIKELLARASKDVPVDWEKERLLAIETALKTARPEDVGQLEARLNEVHDSILAKLYGEYGRMEEGYKKLSLLESVLEEGEKIKLEKISAGVFNDFGKIDFEEAAGRLKDAAGALDEMLARVQARTPSLLQKHLREQAVVERNHDVPVAGGKTLVHYRTAFKNELPLEYERKLELGVRLPEGAIVTSASPEIEIAGGVYLARVEENAEYSLEYDVFEKLVEIDGIAVHSQYADLERAAAEETVLLNALEDTDAVVIVNHTFPLESAEADEGKTVFFSNSSSSQARILLHASKGANEVKLKLLIANPVSLERKITSAENGTLVEYALESKVIDLSDFQADVIEQACNGNAHVIGEKGLAGINGVKTVSENGLLITTIQARDFKLFEKKTAIVKLDCEIPADNPPPNTSIQSSGSEGSEFDLAAAGELWKQAVEIERICGECTAEVKKQLLVGDIQKAREELGKAREDALAKLAGNSAEEKRMQEAKAERDALQQNAAGAIVEFDKAFAPSEESASELSRSMLFQEGKKAKADLDKLLKDASRADTAAALESLLSRAGEKIRALSEIAAQQQDKADGEIKTAGDKQKQFGDADTNTKLQEAVGKAESGNSFTAWVLARRLNDLFDKTGSDGKKQDGELGWLGIAAAVCLLGLAVLFLRRKSVLNSS